MPTATSETSTTSATSADCEPLWDILHNRYFRLRPTIRSEHTRLQYRLAVNDFAEMLDRKPCKADLNDDNLNALLIYLLDKRGLCEVTANERVGRLKTLWTWMAKRGTMPCFPTVSRIPQPERVPRAWNADELRRLFGSFAQEEGELCGVPAKLWWLSSHAFLWNSGERKGATFLFRFDMLDWKAGVAILPPEIRKGRRKSAVYLLWPEVLDMIKEIRLPRRELVWPWPYHPGTYYNRYERILKRAGLPCGRHHKTQAMRVSHATWLHAMGHDATAALGHGSPETTRKSYLDSRTHSPRRKAAVETVAPRPRLTPAGLTGGGGLLSLIRNPLTKGTAMNPAAALVAKRWAKPGSRKRQAEHARKIAESMTPAARSARAKKAAAARWNGKKKSQSATIISGRDAKKRASKRQSP